MPDRRWIALIALCLGVVMIVLDGTVVTVALPLIRADLGFSQAALVWVINAYILTFGGCLLWEVAWVISTALRRVFLIDWWRHVRFARVWPGYHPAAEIWARAVQGAGGAVVRAVSWLSSPTMFIETGETRQGDGHLRLLSLSAGANLGRAARWVHHFILDWHWVFLVNIPFGMVVYALCLRLLPDNACRTYNAGNASTCWGP